jgi:hypothetical protein
LALLNGGARPGERGPAGEELVAHDAHRVDVGTDIEIRPPLALLGGHVLRRPHGLARASRKRRAPALVQRHRRTEVDERGPPRLGEEDVFRLEVPMDIARGVDPLERDEHREHHRGDIRKGHRIRPGDQTPGERRRLEAIHHRIERAVVELTPCVEGRYVGGADPGQGLDLTREVRCRVGPIAPCHLDRHPCAARLRLRREDRAKAAPAEDALEHEALDRGTFDHGHMRGLVLCPSTELDPTMQGAPRIGDRHAPSAHMAAAYLWLHGYPSIVSCLKRYHAMFREERARRHLFIRLSEPTKLAVPVAQAERCYPILAFRRLSFNAFHGTHFRSVHVHSACPGQSILMLGRIQATPDQIFLLFPSIATRRQREPC